MAYDWKYLPILKWKKGEQYALRELTSEQWEGVTPLIELQPIDAAPDLASLKAALPDYIDEVASQIKNSIPDNCQVFIDTRLVSSGYTRQASLLVAICDQIRRKISRSIYPAVGAGVMTSLGALSARGKEILMKSSPVLLRLRSDQIDAAQVAPIISELIAVGIRKKSIHLLIDQYSLVGREPGDCAATITPYLTQAIAASCASLTLAGGSFPTTLSGIKAGAKNIPRVEWQIWKIMMSTGNYSSLRYADYAVTNPAPLPEIDPRTVNPSITIRYATNDAWYLLKGRGFRGAPAGEYTNLCKLLVTNQAIYSGKDFSFGDGKYFAAASGVGKNGVPWTWRREATSHHIVLTARAL